MNPPVDLWHGLKEASDAGRPVVMYGMGNGADKILAVLADRGIPVADFFASDGFVRGHSFHGRVVLSYSAMKDRYRENPPIVLLSFASSRPEVLALIEQVAAECALYIPDVPVCGTELFDAAFVEAHRDEIDRARSLLADEESRRVLDGIIEAKLTGRMELLRATESDGESAFRNILRAERFRTVMDLGAYNGDTIRELRNYAPALDTVIAMEPDRRNFRKLDAYAAALREAGDPLRILPVEAGAWSEDTARSFHGSGNRNAGLSDETPPTAASPIAPSDGNPYFGKAESVSVRAPDALMQAYLEDGALPADTRVDYIKYDVEGAEREALLGSRALIRRDAPALLVSVYHRSGDLFELPLLVHELNPAYRLFLRRMPGVPAWDLNLYAVKD